MPFEIHALTPNLVCSRLVEPVAETDWTAVLELGKQFIAGKNNVVVCTDWSRQVEELDTQSLEVIASVLATDNDAIARSGFLLAASPFMLQLSRLTVHAANPNRRLLYRAEALIDWLRPALDEPGLSALSRYVGV